MSAIKRRCGPAISEMTDPQLLAYLLGLSGLEPSGARELAHVLLRDCQSLDRVLRLPLGEMLAYPGLGEGSATFLLMLPALIQRYNAAGDRPTFPMPLWDMELMRRQLAPYFQDWTTERVYVFCLREDMDLITASLVAQGGTDAVSCSVRRVMELALSHRSRGVVLAHNHPNGTAAFSKEDILATAVLANALTAAGVPLLDHFLLAGDQLCSLNLNLDENQRPCLFFDAGSWASLLPIFQSAMKKQRPPR